MSVIGDILKKGNPLNPNRGVANNLVEEPQDGALKGVVPGTDNAGTKTQAGAGGGQQQAGPVTWADMINSMYKMPTKEEVEAQKKRQQRDERMAAVGDTISSIANMFATAHGASNAYDPKSSMYATTKARWDRLNKQRDDEMRSYLPIYMQARAHDEANARDERTWKHQLEREAVADQQRKDALALQREQYEDTKAARERQFETQTSQWQQQFDEGKRRFNAQQGETRRYHDQLAARAASNGRGGRNSGKTMVLGSGRSVHIPADKFNDHNIELVFSKLPDEVKKQVMYEPMTYKSGRERTNPDGTIKMKPRKYTTDDMLRAIGQHVETNQAVRAAWQEVGGEIIEPEDDDDDFSQYAVGGASEQQQEDDDEWSQYIVK